MINDFQESVTWKIQLIIAINFISSKDGEEKRVIHLKSDKSQFKCYNDINEAVDELFKTLRSGNKDNLEKLMRGSELIFDLVQLVY